MAGRRRGFFRAPRNNEWVQQARQVLTTAFLDMDQRQSIAEAAVAASAALFPDRGMAARWEAVRARCYAASGAYLALNDRLEQVERDEATVTQPEIDTVIRGLADAARGVDEFYRGNQAHLEHAVAVQGAVPQLVAQVRGQAARLRQAADASPYAGYPSIRQCAAAVDEGLLTLEAAVAAGAGGATRDAATRLDTLTRKLSTALEAAPAKQHSAATAVTSAATRLDAARNRLERIAPAMSALLREFAAASSSDLANNERQAREAVDDAAADLSRARTALADHDPEEALDLTTTARARLATAEERAEAVTDRLALLRQVREQPAERAKAVRFKLRDAQMLAVNKGVVPQWGSVLDAQAERLDRAGAGLTGRHPDYWAYVSELDAISAFVAGVVDRMRNTER
ncbi:hypothetical protein [Nocardia seriolae]|uniref:hypothetical protein n=2 Tax=Nocardia seriolae TaxID=37332 RepID=UPI000D12A97F|nr:hypothetical protein [Nocardia seriolae]PSK30077.1 hypothetical protein C6575_17790 [Nocardia seriolae]QOW32117.1 hypothetical protein IMZ23_29565 [Nocardia seriolae]QUN19728.1 hypothetical protein KEC46_10635 [Nocardia seriolae]WNJ59202.1 hypothetical protein RMO66_38795 [Nocardia seriolae]